MAIQMMVIIVVFGIIGFFLDKQFNTSIPFLTFIFLTIGVFGSIYQIYKSLQ